MRKRHFSLVTECVVVEESAIMCEIGSGFGYFFRKVSVSSEIFSVGLAKVPCIFMNCKMHRMLDTQFVK